MANGKCEDCKKIKECKKTIGIIWGFCNTDFEPKDEVKDNDNNTN